MGRLLLFLLMTVGLVACDQKGTVDTARDKARLEGEAGRDVDNRNLAEKAKRMESELGKRHFFYSAVEGEYEGTVRVGSKDYGIRFTFAKSLPAYQGDRTRQLSEIEADINNLFFTVQVVQWHPADLATAVGCRIAQIRPDINKGTIILASPECPNVYEIYLSQLDRDGTEDKAGKAKELAEKLNSETIKQVEALIGSVQPSLNANSYPFQVTRKAKE